MENPTGNVMKNRTIYRICAQKWRNNLQCVSKNISLKKCETFLPKPQKLKK